MKIILKATQLELTPAIRDYIEGKIGSLEKLIGEFETKGEIKVTAEIARSTKHHRKGDIFYAELNLYLPGKILRAEHSDWDIRVAMDNVKDKLRQEIKKYKESRRGATRKKKAKLREKL